MPEKIYVLWGDKNKKFGANNNLFNYIYKKLDIKNENVWDGYYFIDDLNRNEDLYRILKNCLTDEKISFDTKERFIHSIGRGSIEYIWLLENKKIRIVDAVVYPDEDEIECLLRNIGNDCELIAFGGGTSVTGGVLPTGMKKFTVSIDTKNFNFLSIDKESMILEAGAGIRGPDLENELNKSDLTLGNFPESFEYSTLGGWISTNAAGQESNRYGKIKDMVMGVKLVTPTGIYSDHKVPAESAFFKVSDISVGSEGTFGIITRAWLKLHKKPENLFFKSIMFKNFIEGIEVLKKEFTAGKSPIVSRLSDEQETYLSILAIKDNFLTKIFKFYLKQKKVLENGSILILMDDKKISMKDGINLGSMPAKYWYQTRFDRPYMYNELLKHGIVAETIETSSPWSNVEKLYKDVISSFNEEMERIGIKGLIMCHASHEYISGTALYFTFIFYSVNEREKILNLLRNAVITSMINAGGSISHHHGIGTYLTDQFPLYKGNAYSIIKSMKEKLDPENILNPGIIK
ncbi:MAG: FAD-binding oxidoreductase [Thermoplasmata archaeon]